MTTLYHNTLQTLQTTRTQLARTVNFAMVEAYWKIGQTIVEEEQQGKYRAEYGANLMEYLAKRLTLEFGNSFNERNLYYMKQFYSQFPNLNALRSELSWTHYRALLRVENPSAREFYIAETIANNWGTRKTTALSHQDIGQMDMYVRLYEDKYKAPDDNPTIGLILCSDKDHTIAKYSVLNDSTQLFAAKYMLYLPTEEELRIELEREKARLAEILFDHH